MKILKLLFYSLLSVAITSCGFSSNSTSNPSEENSSFSFFGNSQKTYEFKDPRSGLLVSTAEYPSSWEILTKAEYDIDPIIPAFRYQIKGPDGMQAFNTPLKLYKASTSAQQERMMRNMGMKNVKSLKSSQQLWETEIAPKLNEKGFSFLNTTAFPELEQKARRETSKHVSVPFELTINGVVWQNNNGQKALVILNYLKLSQPTTNGNSTIVWMYSTDVLFSHKDEFDTNVAAFVKASLESDPTPEWKNHMATLKAQRQEEGRRQTEASNARMRQSAIAHQNRMAQKQANFNAHQQKMQGIWAAQDASHASFMNRNFGSNSSTAGSYNDSGQQSFVNMIHGEETVSHTNGNSYQITAGAKETWMDSDGNAINSNNLFFDPNANPNNNTQWTKVWEDY